MAFILNKDSILNLIPINICIYHANKLHHSVRAVAKMVDLCTIMVFRHHIRKTLQIRVNFHKPMPLVLSKTEMMSSIHKADT